MTIAGFSEHLDQHLGQAIGAPGENALPFKTALQDCAAAIEAQMLVLHDNDTAYVEKVMLSLENEFLAIAGELFAECRREL